MQIDDHLGVGIAPTSTALGYFYDTAINTTATHYGVQVYVDKEAGATDASDALYGMKSYARMNQSGGTLGDVYGGYFEGRCLLGTASQLWGVHGAARSDGGTVTDGYGVYGYVTGTFSGDKLAGYFYSDDDTVVRITGYEGKDAILELFADQGDNTIDKWRIRAEEDVAVGYLHIETYGAGSWESVITVDSVKDVGFANHIYLTDSNAIYFGDGFDAGILWNGSNLILDCQSNGDFHFDNGNVQMSSLAGTGSRTVVADANGVLSAP